MTSLLRRLPLLVSGLALALLALPGTDLAAAQGVQDGTIPAPNIPLPTIPERRFLLTDFQAKGDGVADDSAAIARAIAACAQAGGGRLVVPKGTYLTGPITFVDHLELHLEEGATLRFLDDPARYHAPMERGPSVEDDVKYATQILTPVNGTGLTDIAITGKGTLDGNGKNWWIRGVTKFRANGKPAEQPLPRPHFIQFMRCTRVLIEGVTVTNSPQFNIVPHHCRDVTCRDLTILNPPLSPNTDGIDPANSSNVLITRCRIDGGDDHVSFKAYRNEQGQKSDPTENVWVLDCTMLHGHGISVGSRVWSGIRNIYVDSCTFDGADNGLRIKSSRERGGLMENIVMSNVTMGAVEKAVVVNMYYFDKDDRNTAKPVTDTTPIVRKVLIRNVKVRSAEIAGELVGLPEMPLADIRFENVQIAGDRGFTVLDAKPVVFQDVRITAKEGKALTIERGVVQGAESYGDTTPVPGSAKAKKAK